MRWVKCIDSQGKIDILPGKAKAAEHITAATNYTWSEYYIQQAADNGRDIAGFQFSWATPEEVQQYRASTVTDTVEEISRAGDMHQDGATADLNAPTGDRLADGFRSFGIGVTVMDRLDTPVPYGYFYATAMLRHAGKVPYKFLQARRTIKIIENLSTRLGLAADEIAIPFLSGPYQGTWVHRDLALRLAEYCDDTCHLETAVGQAISALTDRTPAAAPAPFTAPTVPLSEQERALSLVHVAAAEAQAIAIKGDAAAAAEEKTFAVRVKQAELEERRLAVAKQYTKLERSHLKDVGNIQVINTERQAAAKRKQQEESAAQAKKHAKMQAETQAAKDKQDQLRRQTAQQPTRLSLVPHRNAASNLRTGSTPMSGTFVMDEAVHKAAEKMGIAYSQVIKFMRAKRGNKTGYQKVLEDTHLVKKGTQVRVNENIGYYPVGVYPKSKLDAAVKWIRRKYTAQG